MKVIGHRGARGLAPENTLAALEAGIAAGADEVEIDVRVTKDDIPVVNHNKRINGALIFMHTFAELKAHKPDLCTLEEAVRAVNRRVPIMIEVKSGEPTEHVVEVVKTFLAKKWKAGDFRFGSKSQKTLVTLHKALPSVPVVVIQAWSSIHATWRARKLQTKFIYMNHLFVWYVVVSAMRKHGFKLSVYTLNKPEKAARWEKHGLFGVVTDFPDRFS